MAFIAALTIGGTRLAPDAYGVTVVGIALLGSMGFAWLFALQTEGRTPALRRWVRQLGRRPASA
jgi:hypothetical protein